MTSYVEATLTDATALKLRRLCYVGSATNGSSRSTAPATTTTTNRSSSTGLPIGTCQDALDTACGLYLNDPTAWAYHPTNLRPRPLS